MIARRLLVCAVLVACETGEIRDPGEFTPASRIPDEPLFGTIFHQGSQLRRTTVSNTFKTGPGLVYLYEGPGWDKDLVYREAEASVYRFDPATGAGTKIAGPSLTPGESHQFGLSSAEGSAVLVVGRSDGLDVAYFDGATWTTTPGPIGASITGARILARSASELLLYTNTDVHYYNGSSWRTVPRPSMADGTGVTPGPWDAAGAQILFAYNGQQVCTVLYPPAALASGGPPTPTCLDAPNQGLAAGYAVNGTTSDFQVLARTADNTNVRAIRFAGANSNVGGAFGDANTTVLLGATGSPRPLATSFTSGGQDLKNYYPALQVVEGGELGALMLDDMRARSLCTCNRDTDPSCGCFTRDAEVVVGSVSSDGAHFGLVIVDDVDARRSISMRMFVLPYDEDPFPLPACTLTCGDTAVCVVDPVSGESSCVIPDPNAGKVTADIIALPADPVTAGMPEATSTLTAGAPSCGINYPPNLGYDVQLDPYCTYSLDATAPGHVAIHVDNIQTGSENEHRTIGPYTLARGALLDDTALASSGFDDTTRLVVSPAGGRMILSLDGEWRWIETSGTAPYFTSATLAASPNEAGGVFPYPANPRWVGASSALVHTSTQGIALVENGAVVSTLAGAFDLSKAVVARNASVAIVPSGSVVTNATHPGVSSEVTFVSFAGSTVSAVRTVTANGFGHTIRANGTQAAYFTVFGHLVFIDTASTTTNIGASWNNRAGLRVALGGASDWLVVAPQAATPDPTAPCATIQLCGVFAQEDVPGDPGDPVIRQTVTLSTRALWAEIGESVGHVAWLERDVNTVVHLYRRDTYAGTTTEISLGGSYASDLAHAVVGDKLLVMVPTGIVVLDIATGVSRMETGTFAVANQTDREPLVRVDDGRRIWMREACVLGGDPCGLRVYDATTDTMTSLSSAVVSRFGVANDRAVDGAITVTTYNGSNAAIRSYALTAGTADDVEPTFRTSRGRGAPCIVYWREEPWAPTTRRWYCSD